MKQPAWPWTLVLGAVSMMAAVPDLSKAEGVTVVARVGTAADAPRMSLPVAPSDAQLRQLGLFALPLVPVAKTSVEENAALARALEQYQAAVRAQGARDAVDSLNAFLSARPQSPWLPVLLVNLGTIYRQTGHFSLALTTWQRAWSLTKQEQSEYGRAIGDAAAAHLSQLEAYLGRKELLAALLAEIAQRPLHGTAAELVNESARGLADMRLLPELSFKCGPFALSRILQFTQAAPSAPALEILRKAHSTPRGLSLSAVRALSKRAGMNYQMAFRSPGAAVIVPAVAHWNVGHYAALVAREAGFYRVQDATFGEDVRMRPETLDAEASGYFLVPPGALPAGWRSVTAAEGATVWGRGDTGNNKDNGATGPADAQVLGTSSCQGCATWSVEPMVVSLALHDVPVSYGSAIGPQMRFDVYYSHRDVQQPQLFNYGNLGRKWTTTWLSYVTDNTDLNGTLDLYRRGGGNETFRFGADATRSLAGPFSQTRLVRKLDAAGQTVGFRREFADGAREDFMQALGVKFFLTAVVDPQGNALSLGYDDQMRITGLTDALGRTTTLSYALASDPLKITSVTDPFGRAAKFGYGSDGNLQTITDTLGITSTFSYGAGDFISALETPYGKTSFEYGDSTTDPDLGNTRFVNISDALGRTSRVEFRHTAPDVPASETRAQVPSGLTVNNDLLQWRNTFLWNPAQYAAALKDGKLDYGKASLIHFLHTADNSTSRVPESIKEPLEHRVWFDYPGQKDPLYVGASSRPQHVARTLDDGSTQLLSFEYNALGKPASIVDPAGRKFAFDYAANDMDLTAVRNVTGGSSELIVSVSYDERHQISDVATASGAKQHYEYNAHGQVTRVVDALGNASVFSYDPLAALISVSGPMGTSTKFTYDAFGRVISATDATGDTVRYEYDDADRVRKRIYPDETSNEYTYQLLDLVQIKDRSGQVTELVYDAARQLVQLVDAAGQSAKLEYGLDGALTAFIDPAGKATHFVRDLQGRVVSKQYPDGSVWQASYEAGSSRLHRVVDALNQATTYVYNVDDSLAQQDRDGANKSSIRFKYDAQYQRVVSMIDELGETLYGYVAAGQPGAGSLASVTTPVAGASGVTDTIAYGYDALGRVVAQTVADSERRVAVDALGRVTELHNALDAFALDYADTSSRPKRIASGRGPRWDFSWLAVKQDGLLQQLDVTRHDGQALAQFGYRYDRSGRIAAFAEAYRGRKLGDLARQGAQLPAAGSSRSGGDGPADGTRPNPALAALLLALLAVLLASLYQRRRSNLWVLTAALPLVAAGSCSEVRLNQNQGFAQQADYTYDKIGRLTSAQVARDTASAQPSADAKVAGLHSALSKVSYAYRYDASSNLTEISSQAGTHTHEYAVSNGLQGAQYDANGNPTALQDSHYGWDARNRLVSIARGDHISEFGYDSLRRLVRIVEKVAGKVVSDQGYTYCGLSRCLERDNLKAGSPISKQYFGQGFVAGGQHFYYVRDHLGSVRQLVDDTGRVRAQYDYDPYGNITRHSGDVDSDEGFGGYFHHAASGLSFALFRAYDPTHGRWLNRDPIGEAGDANLYAYGAGDPINANDPLGLWAGADDAIAIGGGALVGLIGQGVSDWVHGSASGWEDYVGAAVGGAVAGEVGLYTGGVGGAALGGATSGLVTNALVQGLKMHTGKQCNFDVGSLAIATGAGAVGGVVGGVVAKAMPALAAKALASGNVKVLGRLADTSVAKSWAGHEVLNVADWTLEKNAEWVASGIKARQNFYLASPEAGNLVQTIGDHIGEPTVYALELQQLAAAGYKKIGDYMVHPGNVLNFR